MARNMEKTLCDRIRSIADIGEYSYELEEDLKSLAPRPDGCPDIPGLRDTLVRAIGTHDDSIVQDLWNLVSADPGCRTISLEGGKQVHKDAFWQNVRGIVACALAVQNPGSIDLLNMAFKVWNPHAAGLVGDRHPLLWSSQSALAYCSIRRNESGLQVGQMQDCLEQLLGQPTSRVRNSFTQPVVYVDNGYGYTAALDMTLLEGGCGHSYADPFTAGLLLWADDFGESLQTAWRLAGELAAGEGVACGTFDVRWRLRGQAMKDKGSGRYKPLLPTLLEGPSLGLAMGVSFAQVLRQRPPDPQCVITGALLAGGQAAPVGGVYIKTFDALVQSPVNREDPNRHPITRMIVPNGNKDEALDAASYVKWAYRDAVEPVADLPAACERSSALITEVLAYLKVTAERASELTTLHYGAKGDFDALRQTVQVIEDRSDYEDWLAREREASRSAGHDMDGVDRLAYAPHRSRPELGEDQRERPTPVPWSEDLLRRYPRMVILGDPGFGKSWLLRRATWEMARKEHCDLVAQAKTLDEVVLPIFFHLSRFNRSDVPLEDALETIIPWYPPSATFRSWLGTKVRQTGKCVLFMDGWDEVDQDRLRERLKAFAWNRAGTSMVMASRIVGYGSSPIPQAQELELLAWDQPQMERFARVWFGDEEAGAFLVAIRQSPQIHGLARIPLMLTLLCRGYRPGKALPNRRVDLYRQCLEGLLMDWREDKGKRINKAYIIGLLKVLRAVAFRLFRDGYERFSMETLYDTLTPALSRLPPSHELHGVACADVVSELQETGVLVELGDSLGFLHRTFHEYLAACHLATLVNKKGWSTATVSMSHQKRRVLVSLLLDRKAWLPTWSHVIILLAGELRHPGPFLEMLADEDKDDIHRHRLCLAAQCLPELREPQRTDLQEHLTEITTGLFWIASDLEDNDFTRAVRSVARVDSHVRIGRLPAHLQEILCARGFDGNACPTLLDVVMHLVRARAIRCDLLQAIAFDVASPVVSTTLDLLGSVDDEVRESANFSLGQLCLGSNARVVKALLDRLDDRDEDLSVRVEAAIALGNMRLNGDPRVVQALLDRLDDREPKVALKLVAAEALGKMRLEGDPRVVQVLLDRLDDPEDASIVKLAAAEVLGKMRLEGDPQVVQALLDRLDNRQGNWLVNAPAAEVVRKMRLEEDPQVVQALLDRLNDRQEDLRVREKAADALGEMHLEGNPQVVRALLDRLVDREFVPMVRRAAAEALGKMRLEGDPQVVQALLDRLDDREDVPMGRKAAAEALSRIRPDGDRQTARVLLDRLRDQDEDLFIRVAATIALRTMRLEGDSQVVNALLDRLDDRNEDSWVREAAADALGKMHLESNAQVVQALLDRLRDRDEQWLFRLEAGKVLEKMCLEDDPRVFQALLDQLDDRKADSWLRFIAARALGKMRLKGNPKVVQSLLNRLNDREEDAVVRREALYTLGKMRLEGDLQTIMVLLLHVRDERLFVRAAVEAAIVRMSSSQMPLLLDVLAYLLPPCLLGDSSIDKPYLRLLDRLGARVFATHEPLDPWLVQHVTHLGALPEA